MGSLKKFIPQFLINYYHFCLSVLSAFLYRFPSRNLIVIGVTGTNGKSTVVAMAHNIFTEAGFKTASLSSIRFKIGPKEWSNTLKMTMPGRFRVQKFLREALNAGCKYVILEVTSEGIKQHRHQFINFSAAVFTNLAPEHIESHGGFENYRKAKIKLFQKTKDTHIINLDDANARYFLDIPSARKFGYTANTDSELQIAEVKIVKATDINLSSEGIEFMAGGVKFHLNLPGVFNVYNAIAAISAGLSQGIDLEICRRALEKTQVVPGRMEIVAREPFRVIVDYAHTPDALAKVYETVKINLKGKMICVLGSAGGGRDKWKRPELGKMAARYCDKIILTNEDPYDENPKQILSEIKSGILNSQFSTFNLYEIIDRREAIKKALNLAGAGDSVIVTGKGCEPWLMAARGKKIPWDDRGVAREELEKLRQ